jgi:hypothetical protein
MTKTADFKIAALVEREDKGDEEYRCITWWWLASTMGVTSIMPNVKPYSIVRLCKQGPFDPTH